MRRIERVIVKRVLVIIDFVLKLIFCFLSSNVVNAQGLQIFDEQMDKLDTIFRLVERIFMSVQL